ncbi:MAG: hypothetical protein M1828_001994 [Chrysothrix sp. TS-e1954]|nr:MAG: hypothetical protein M1828_001994 [Chrysothrix sp. TS-e1954]
MPRDYTKAYAQFERSLKESSNLNSHQVRDDYVQISSVPCSAESENIGECDTKGLQAGRAPASSRKALYAAHEHLPPTPPANLPLGEPSSEAQVQAPLMSSSELSTNPQSLPTPDPTPPSSADHSRPRLHDDTPLPSPYTESFRTAKEDPVCSSNTSSYLRLPLDGPLESIDGHQELGTKENLGLRNLGWGMEHIGTNADGGGGEFSAHEEPVRSERIGTELQRDVTSVRHGILRERAFHKGPSNEGLTFLEDEPRLVTPTSESVQSSWLEMSSMERLSRDVDRPHTARSPNSDLATTIDSKRSSASAHSTVVEAMIVDQPSKSSPRLRHLEKKDFLRERAKKDHEQKESPPSRGVPSTSSPRLVHKVGRLPGPRYQPSETSGLSNGSSNTHLRSILPEVSAGDNRTRLTSSLYVTGTFWDDLEADAPHSHRMSVPTAYRRLSLSSSEFEANPLATFYSHASSARPTSQDRSVESLDLKSLVDELPKSKSDDLDDSEAFFPLEGVSAQGHYNPQIINSNTERRHPVLETSEPFERDRATLNPIHQISAQMSPLSCSDGTDAQELSQATAVSIFPHNKRSLMVVQQPSRYGARTIPENDLRTLSLLEDGSENSTPHDQESRNEPEAVYEPGASNDDSSRGPTVSVAPLRSDEKFAPTPNPQPDSVPVRSRSMMNRARQYSDNIFQPIRNFTSSNSRLFRRNTTRKQRSMYDRTVPNTTTRAERRNTLLNDSSVHPELDDSEQTLRSSSMKRGRSIKGLFLTKNALGGPHSQSQAYDDPTLDGSKKRKRGNLTGPSPKTPSVSVRASARQSGR